LVISHFLIGPPSSGKSTLANQLVQLVPTARIVSTDAIRGLLFGDESLQGEWSLVEKTALSQIQEALAVGCPVIYDATNARPEWRQSILKQVKADQVQWLAWQLQTPLSLCQAWNKQRQRQVPSTVIQEFFQALQQFPPSTQEGFAVIHSVFVTEQGFDIARVEYLLQDFTDKTLKAENCTQK